MKLTTLITGFLLLLGGILQAQVKFEAKVSKERLGVNERLRVDFEMNQDGDNFKPPSFDGFSVVGGPNQSVSNSWINGQRSYSKTYSFYLQPNSRGKKTIGQAEIIIDNKTYKTSPLAVEVTAAVDKPTDGNNANLIASDNLHLVAEVSNTSPYLNEAINVVYKLYVSPRVSVSNWRELDNPKYADFWSQNMDIKQLRVENGEFRGEPYRYVVLRRTVLYPQKTGELTIEPLTLSIAVDVPTERRDLFGGRIYTTVDKTVAAGSRTINVKPLPSEGRPASFTGAVGKYEFDVSLNKNELNATESVQAKVQVKGTGNLKLFDLPRLNVPSSIEMYEPERAENISTNLSGMQGSLAETYTLVPSQKGKYPIQPMEFSWFDPETGTYKKRTSAEMLLDVGERPGGAALASGRSGGKQPIAANPDAFRFIKQNANLKAIGSPAFINSWKYWTALISPLLLIPLAIVLGKKREALAADAEGNRQKKANRLARKYLSEAKKNKADRKMFYVALEKALHNYLKAKLKITTVEMSKDRISEILQEKGVEPGTRTEFLDLLKSCEFARYTPASTVAIEQDYERSVSVISELDKSL